MEITIQIDKKRASAIGSPVIICGNSDYIINFIFDDEWQDITNKTARFVYRRGGREYWQDVIFEGNTVAVPVLSNIGEVDVGVYAGNLRTSTPAKIFCDRSILCEGKEEEELTISQYTELMNLMGALTARVEALEAIPEAEGASF